MLQQRELKPSNLMQNHAIELKRHMNKHHTMTIQIESFFFFLFLSRSDSFFPSMVPIFLCVRVYVVVDSFVPVKYRARKFLHAAQRMRKRGEMKRTLNQPNQIHLPLYAYETYQNQQQHKYIYRII